MKDWPTQLGAALLVPAILFGAARAVSVVGLLRQGSEPSVVQELARGAFPGEEVLAAAERTDRLASELDSTPPLRSPFARPSVQRAASQETAFIPQVVRIFEDEGTGKVVLSLGPESFPPLASQQSFRGWRVIQVGRLTVFIEREGVIYTLPVP